MSFREYLTSSETIWRYGLYGLGVICAIALWYLSTSDPEGALYKFNPVFTAQALYDLFLNARFWEGVFETLKRLFGGLAIATILGVLIGVPFGYFMRFQHFVYVPFQFLRYISPLSWTPIAIIVFGIGSAPVYFLIAIAAIWPVIINTAVAVRNTEDQWIDMARSLGAKNKDIIRHVLIRSALPSMLVGVQLALGVAWIVLVPAEMLGVASGLGYMILDFRDVNDYASIMGVIISIGFLGLMTDIPLRLAIKAIDWRD